MPDSYAIEVQALSYDYPRKRDALVDVSFDLVKGQALGLLGVNGAGKSTLIQCLTGQLRPTSGDVAIMGQRFDTSRQGILSQLALVPQGEAFYPRLTVSENLRFFARLRPDLPDFNERVNESLDVCQLNNQQTVLAARLSGGLKRRLNLAIGLVNRPSLLLLDEPTVGIDPISKDAILGVLESLKTKGMTLVYTSHQLAEVERLCDQLVVLDRGKTVFQGTVAALTKAQGHRFEARINQAWSKVTRKRPEIAKWLQQWSLQTQDGWVQGQLPAECDLAAFTGRFLQQLQACPEVILQQHSVQPLSMEAAFFELLGESHTALAQCLIHESESSHV
ncbi:ABC transporter ATP-binding protein [Hydrogenovibrio halophilus]|uniref:ABC transporter ATP-binding protein n=1 Tax=Hydrogenovibrio halophilus TaxID=373391 RepID=UPI000364780F|nr:ABC transporter ATP-binding protein [Hydrogenovibrio halophilus]